MLKVAVMIRNVTAIFKKSAVTSLQLLKMTAKLESDRKIYKCNGKF